MLLANAIEFTCITIMLLPLLSALLVMASNNNFYSIRNWVMPFCSFITVLNFILLAINFIKSKVDYHEFKLTLLADKANYFINFRIDNISLFFVGLVLILWFITSLYSKSYLKVNNLSHQTSFLVFVNLAICCTIFIGFVVNKIALFIGYELLTLFTYPLVGHYQTQNSIRAANKYLTILLTTSLTLLLPGLMLIEINESNLYYLISLILILLGTSKIALMPFNSWLPAAMVAPTPVSALLHAVAVVKAGTILIIKIIAYHFGFSKIASLYHDYNLIYLIILGYLGANIIFASFKATKSYEFKQVLAYSTIANLSYIIFVAILPLQNSIDAALILLVTHAVSKIGLFFAAGLFSSGYGIKKIQELEGMAYQQPLAASVICLSSISLWGLPPLFGFWAKKTLFTQLEFLPWQFNLVFVAASILSVIYLGKIIGILFKPAPISNSLTLQIDLKQIFWMRVSLFLIIILLISMAFLGYLYFA